MTVTDELRPAVLSELTDLRDVPLAEVPDLDAGALRDVLGRLFPETAAAPPVPVAAFNSSI
jgi:FXSXX-COOH protein